MGFYVVGAVYCGRSLATLKAGHSFETLCPAEKQETISRERSEGQVLSGQLNLLSLRGGRVPGRSPVAVTLLKVCVEAKGMRWTKDFCPVPAKLRKEWGAKRARPPVAEHQAVGSAASSHEVRQLSK